MVKVDEMDRLEKMVVNTFATKRYVLNIEDRIEDFVKQEDMEILKHEGE